ncbi:hypothetical protein HMPREF9248_0069 [Fannyhessea vaginae PB189-T1-4]|uniref:Uncharacterized protein n=1 Tax=Fannyhessea vaginae PB189-T1-4 TaxID=866774 RepID=A0ABN0AYT6_9ACTN|nr:hypothetical protein HMPREF9248_0069 [Fannyhessea vaginae PB189-T1-4]
MPLLGYAYSGKTHITYCIIQYLCIIIHFYEECHRLEHTCHP